MKVFPKSYDDRLPVSLTDAKLWARITSSFEDATVDRQLRAAVVLCERAARISILPRVWVGTFRLPRATSYEFGIAQSIQDPEGLTDGVVLPYPSATSVTRVDLVKQDGSLQSLAAADWVFSENAGAVRWTNKDVVRDFLNNDYEVLEIEWAAGFAVGDNTPVDPTNWVMNIPGDITEAILTVFGDLYENRGGEGLLPAKAWQILSSYYNNVRMAG